MNIRRFIGIAVFAAMCVLPLWGGISHAVVVGSKHDLSATGGSAFNFATEQVCVFCHTPHGGNSGIHESTFYNATTDPATYDNTAGSGSLLLWNRALSNANSYSGYDTYQSSTMDASTGQVRAYSLLCLSCHDGVAAMNVLTNPPGDDNPDNWSPFNPMDPLSGADQIGDADCLPDAPCANIGERWPSSDSGLVNLTNDHPISFDYDATLVSQDSGLQTPNNTAGYVVDTRVRLFPNPSGELKSVECSTCHDPHVYGTGSQIPFLVMSNSGSALCLNCHIK